MKPPRADYSDSAAVGQGPDRVAAPGADFPDRVAQSRDGHASESDRLPPSDVRIARVRTPAPGSIAERAA